MDSSRRVENLHPDFFNDGYWYVLTSRSLGGGGLDATSIANALQAEDPAPIRALLEDGACLPLQFPGDCAMDGQTRFVVGALSEDEEAEWIGRVRGVLNIADGAFILMGGGTDEHFEEMLATTEQDPDAISFHQIDVSPGRYLVEVYCFVGSMTVNFAWEGGEEGGEEDEDEERSTQQLRSYWQSTRPGEPEPGWLKGWADEGYVDNEEENLLAYLVRLEPFEGSVPLPEQNEETQWISEFEIRRPPACPRGIPFRSEGD